MKFPILYKGGNGRKWKIWVEDNIIFRTDGLISKEFMKTPSQKKINGKRNTSDNEQAILEAKRAWIKKIDGGFQPDPDDIEGIEMYNALIEQKQNQGGNNHGTTTKKGALKNNVEITGKCFKFEPMLAFKYNEKIKRVIWDINDKEQILKKIKPKKVKDEEIILDKEEVFSSTYFDATDGAYVQRKIDGLRCISFIDNNKLVCLSRNNKEFKFLKEQKEEIYNLLKDHPNVILDGEWYVHSPIINGKLVTDTSRFSFITSACKTVRNTPHPNENLIEYHVFDIIDYSKPQKNRFHMLKKIIGDRSTFVKLVTYKKIHSESEMMHIHDDYFKNGYEGIILRDINGYYENKRSLNLLKHKHFDDSEFKIIGANKAAGTQEGAVVWICQTESGKEFTCTIRKTVEEKVKMYKKRKLYIGKMLTVRYQGLSEIGVPRFPVGIEIRDYE